MGISAEIGDEVAKIRHEYKNGSAVELRFFAVLSYRGEVENRIFREVRWAKRDELPTFDFLEADLPLVRDLADGKIIQLTDGTKKRPESGPRISLSSTTPDRLDR